jgi:hypothetical protein
MLRDLVTNDNHTSEVCAEPRKLRRREAPLQGGEGWRRVPQPLQRGVAQFSRSGLHHKTPKDKPMPARIAPAVSTQLRSRLCG